MKRLAATMLLAILLAPLPAARAADGPSPPASGGEAAAPSREMARLLRKHDKKVARELRQIKREIAALRQSQEEPGVREIMAGIGYILGLCGAAALVASRRRQG